MSGDRVLVWEGRFQPVHRGHVAFVRELVPRADRLVVVVVANETSDERASAVPAFSAVVDEHHRSEKNPWPLWLRHRLVQRTLAATFPDADITVLGGHRLDLDWPLYDRLLPEGRIFAVPTRDEFEDAKAAAWQELGQSVERIPVAHLPEVSGTLVRSTLADGQGLEELLEPVTYRELAPYLHLAGPS